MLPDKEDSGGGQKETVVWPPKGMWVPIGCTESRKLCADTAFLDNEPCSWCGRCKSESFDTEENFMINVACACGCGVIIKKRVNDWPFVCEDPDDSGKLLYFSAPECMDSFLESNPKLVARTLDSHVGVARF